MSHFAAVSSQRNRFEKRLRRQIEISVINAAVHRHLNETAFKLLQFLLINTLCTARGYLLAAFSSSSDPSEHGGVYPTPDVCDILRSPSGPENQQ